jgi:hypothetical protein
MTDLPFFVGVDASDDGTSFADKVQANFDALSARLLDTGGRQVALRWGKATLPFGGGTSGTVTVSHGLVGVPVAVVTTPLLDSYLLNVYVSATTPPTSTQITFHGESNTATGDTDFYWLAIG